MAKTMVSWQVFSSFPPSLRAPRASLAPETPLPFLFKACHAGYRDGRSCFLLKVYASCKMSKHVEILTNSLPQLTLKDTHTTMGVWICSKFEGQNCCHTLSQWSVFCMTDVR